MSLGVNALHGRVLQPQDETARARVAVVSESFWRSRLYADPAAVGRSFKLSGETFEIVGVARGTFHGVDSFLPGSIWIPEVAVPVDLAAKGCELLLHMKRAAMSSSSRPRPALEPDRSCHLPLAS